MTPVPSVVSELVSQLRTEGKKPVCNCGTLSNGENEAGKRQESLEEQAGGETRDEEAAWSGWRRENLDCALS